MRLLSDRIQYAAAVFIYAAVNGVLEVFEHLLFRWKLPANPKTILIFRHGNLGDTFCAVPALSAVEKQFPNARRIFMTNATHGDLPAPPDVLKGIIAFDEILVYDPEKIKDRAYLKTLLSDLRKRNIDLLIYFGQSIATPARLIRDLFFFKAAGVKAVRGFHYDTHWFFAKAQRRYRRFDSEPVRLLKRLGPLGAGVSPAWPLDETTFPVQNFKLAGPLVAVCPSSKYPAKRWPLSRFIEVANHVIRRHGASIVILGGADAQADAGFLAQALPENRVKDLTGKTSFLETAGILKQASFLLSNDSGPVHLAAAVHTPVVGVYSARDYPNAWAPWGDRHEIFRKDVHCQVCYLDECPTRACLKAITVEEVRQACDRLLERS